MSRTSREGTGELLTADLKLLLEMLREMRIMHLNISVAHVAYHRYLARVRKVMECDCLKCFR